MAEADDHRGGDQMTGLRARLEALTPRQKQALAERLALTDPSRSGTKGLNAYVVLDDTAPNLDALHTEAKKLLPGHMVPDTITALDQMPRRPNGKIDTRALPTPMRASPPAQQTQASTTAPSDIETVLLDIWCDLLGTDYLEPTDNFFEFGGDSILAIQVIARARDAGLVIAPRQLLENPTIADLASLITWQEDTGQSRESTPQGMAPALPVQQWFLGQNLAEPGHWNSARLLELQRKCSNDILQAAIDAVLERHAGLRVRFSCEDGHWLQRITEVSADAVLTTHTVAGLPPSAQAQALHHAQRGFDLASGPLIRFTRIETGTDDHDQLLITAHHLVIDEVSWPILIEDLNLSIQQMSEGETPCWNRAAASPLNHASKLKSYAGSPSFGEDLTYWNALAQREFAPLTALEPLRGDHCEAHMTRTSRTLSGPTIEALRGPVHASFNTRTEDLVTSAFALALQSLSGQSDFLFDTESHGRADKLDLPNMAPAIGWFTAYFPVAISPDPSGDPIATLKRVKEQLRLIPNNGIAFGVARYWKNTTEGLPIQDPEILLNYLGVVGHKSNHASALKLINLEQSNLRASKNARSHALEINMSVLDDSFEIVATHVESTPASVLVNTLLDKFAEHLQTLVDAIMGDQATGFTPSDFPDAGLDQDELDAFLEGL